MLTLRTVYPYGLNDRVGDEYMTNREPRIMGIKFPSLKRSINHPIRNHAKHNNEQNAKSDYFVKS